jgi:hypothetical protein
LLSEKLFAKRSNVIRLHEMRHRYEMDHCRASSDSAVAILDVVSCGAGIAATTESGRDPTRAGCEVLGQILPLWLHGFLFRNVKSYAPAR